MKYDPTLASDLQNTSKYLTFIKPVALMFLGGLSVASFSAHADPIRPDPANNKNGINVGINVMYAENGYDTDDNEVAVLPSVFYDNGKVYARGSQLGGYFMNNSTNEFAAFIEPGGSHFDPDDVDRDDPLRQLDERKWSGMVGLSYLRKTPYGGFRGQIETDVFDESDGTMAKLTYIGRLTPGNWTIYPSVGLEWVDEDFNEYYYGVTDKESAKSGVKSYNPDSSVSPYVNVSATYDFNEDWAGFLGQSIKYLSDEQRDSPMVDDDFSYRTTVGMIYKF